MEAGPAIRRLAGGLLIAVGVLVSLTGGLCGGVGVIWAIGYWDVGNQRDTLLLSLVGGTLTIGVGVGLFLAGRHLIRLDAARSPERARPDAQTGRGRP